MTQSSRTCTKCGGEKVSIYARICHLCGAESESASKTITSASPEPTKPLVTTTWSRGESTGTNTPITPVNQTTANEDVTQRVVPVTRGVPDYVCLGCGASNTRYRATLGNLGQPRMPTMRSRMGPEASANQSLQEHPLQRTSEMFRVGVLGYYVSWYLVVPSGYN